MPLATGTKVVDALIPIGRGQRELILGDRQTGKTGIAIDCILNQKGQERDMHLLRDRPAQFVGGKGDRGSEATGRAWSIRSWWWPAGDSAAGLQFVAPYAAMAMGEYFMRKGRDVLVVFDDLGRTRGPIGSYRFSCGVRRAGRVFLATSSTFTRVCWSVPRSFVKSWAAVRSPPCRSSRPKSRISRHTFRPI